MDAFLYATKTLKHQFYTKLQDPSHLLMVHATFIKLTKLSPFVTGIKGIASNS